MSNAATFGASLGFVQETPRWNDEMFVTAAGYPGDQSGPQRNLINYWVHGEGAAKLRWAAPGGFTRCVRHLRSKVPAKIDVKGLCANLHKAATGKWPGEKRHG